MRLHEIGRLGDPERHGEDEDDDVHFERDVRALFKLRAALIKELRPYGYQTVGHVEQTNKFEVHHLGVQNKVIISFNRDRQIRAVAWRIFIGGHFNSDDVVYFDWHTPLPEIVTKLKEYVLKHMPTQLRPSLEQKYRVGPPPT